MIGAFGWAALALLAGYLVLFYWGGIIAGQAAGRSVWLFGKATGRDRIAAFGFRAAFVLAFFGPLVWIVFPMLHKADPFWTEGRAAVAGTLGIFIASLGAMVAFGAQMSMGTSWRVGVAKAETGELVSAGLYRYSRNPTFGGQLILLTGVGCAIPAVPTLVAPVLFLLSASIQIQSEERTLQTSLGSDYERYIAKTPRWIGWPGAR